MKSITRKISGCSFLFLFFTAVVVYSSPVENNDIFREVLQTLNDQVRYATEVSVTTIHDYTTLYCTTLHHTKINTIFPDISHHVRSAFAGGSVLKQPDSITNYRINSAFESYHSGSRKYCWRWNVRGLAHFGLVRRRGLWRPLAPSCQPEQRPGSLRGSQTKRHKVEYKIRSVW